MINEIKTLVFFGSSDDRALAQTILDSGEYDGILGNLKGTFRATLASRQSHV